MKNLKLFLILCLLTVLTGCGGGGGNGGSSNSVPTANSSTSSAASYVVGATAGEGGGVSPSRTTVSSNMTTTFTFTANDGYHLKAVTGCGGVLSNNLFTTGAITADCNVVGVFELTTFDVSVSASANGTYILQSAQVTPGQSVKVTAVPDSGFIVDSFSGCGAGSVDSNTYTTAPVMANCSVSITFKKAATIEGTAAEGAALENADVSAKCSDGSGFDTAVKTDASGHFSGQVGETAFPCALKLTSSNQEKTYFSVAREAGNVNITPFTDLALVIAEGKSGADWYVSDSWQYAIEQLPEAQMTIQNRLNDMGYELPSEEFKPFTTTFNIGDAWDILLDQFTQGLGNSETKTYDALVDLAKTQGVETIPSPTGNTVLTAEVCFNPDLLEGSGYSTVYKSEPAAAPNNTEGAYAGYALNLNYLYGKTVIENGVPILNLESNGDLIYFDNSYMPSHANYISKFAVNFEEKSMTLISTSGTSTSASSGDYIYNTITNYEDVNGKFSFKSAVGVENYITFNAHAISFNSKNGQEGPRDNFYYKHEERATFKGLVNIQRAGKMRRACEVEIKRKITNPNLSVTEGVFSNYYLLGSGIDISSNLIVSIMMNGKEI